MKNLYLIRHIKTKENSSGVFMGKSLNSSIVKDSTENFLKLCQDCLLGVNNGNTLVLSSPQVRCTQTSNLIGDYFKLQEAKCYEELSEVDYGNFEGKSLPEIKKLYPKELEVLVNKPREMVFPNGDKMSSKIETAAKFIESQVKDMSAENVILVTHVDIIKGILFYLMGGDFNLKKYITIDNGSISKLDKYNGKYRILYINKT